MRKLENAKKYSYIMRPLRFGWLHHRHILIVNGCFPTDTLISEITVRNKRKRLKINEEMLEKKIHALECFEDIYEMEDGLFSLISVSRRKTKNKGIAYKVTHESGYVELLWIKLKDINRIVNKIETILLEILKKYPQPHAELSKHLSSE